MKRITYALLALSLFVFMPACKQSGSGQNGEKGKDTVKTDKSSSSEDKDKKLKLDVPKPSPLGSVCQKVGLTDISITYSRPGVKDRKIFGGLVPYNEMWRTGANASTRFEVSSEVWVEGNKIPAGKYSLFTIPRKDQWTIIISKDTTSGKDGIKKSDDAARFKVASTDHQPKVETFTINVTDIRMDTANIQLLWENTSVKFHIKVPTDKMVEAQIKEKLPKAGKDNPMIYYRAAEYYHRADKDREQAIKWVNKALEQKEEYWMLHTKAEIQAAMGNYEEAVKTAEKSKKLAKEEGSDHYVSVNEKKIKEWSSK